MKIYPSDYKIIRSLVEQREKTQSVTPENRKEDQYRWGLHFLDLFRDINDSISFSMSEGSVYVHVGHDTIPHGKDFNEETYMHYNKTMDLQVIVLQRLLLLRRLEEERLIVWVNSGKISANFNDEDRMFYLINEEDKKFVQSRFNYEAVATVDLAELVKNNFNSVEDRRFKKSMVASWTAIAVAIITSLASLIISIIK